MATVGLKMITFGLLDRKTKKLIKGENGLSESGILEIGDEFKVLKQQILLVLKALL